MQPIAFDVFNFGEKTTRILQGFVGRFCLHSLYINAGYSFTSFTYIFTVCLQRSVMNTGPNNGKQLSGSMGRVMEFKFEDFKILFKTILSF